MTSTYRDILQSELEERVKRNPSYSLRAFAQAIGLTPPHLSAILSGRKGLSGNSASKIADALGWLGEEKDEFIDLVNAQHARKTSTRSIAASRIAKSTESKSFKTIDLENFKLISDWHHLAILHLVELHDFEPRAEWIAHRLGLSLANIKEAVARLQKLGMLKITTAGWTLEQKFMATPNVPSRAIRHHLHQGLVNAGVALESQPPEARDFSSVIMAINEESLPEAKVWLRDFRRTFCKKLDQPSQKNALYCLSIQFYEITKKDFR